ncbi:ABC transporter permease [Jiella pacifica]|uniref:ABC transporter permease n=1 Tax=Jiella pacifica TaxID=2696469 RepID=A0A6N9T616_9HYPH|nr:ABC transporter permease [Jiella pacifica]NDW06834.1 ABC transporter permease [Jiella pacifica]
MNVLGFEWIKMRSISSPWLTALSAIFAGTTLSMLGVSDLIGVSPADLPDGWDPTAESLKGFLFAQLLVGMLGAHSITSEYATGLIGTSLAVVPARFRLLAAKTTVVCVMSLGTGIATTLLSFTAIQAMLAGAGLASAGIADPGVARALVGAMLYLTLVGLMGLAVGVLTRSTTASLATLIGVTLLVPAIAPGIPGAVGGWLQHYWPISSGQAAYRVVPVDAVVGPELGLGILAAVTAAVGTAAFVSFSVRDA